MINAPTATHAASASVEKFAAKAAQGEKFLEFFKVAAGARRQGGAQGLQR